MSVSGLRKIATIVTLGTVGAFSSMAAASAGGGCHTGITEAHGTRIEMIDACFTPTTLFAEAGETIRFVNLDGFPHNVTANDWGHFDDLGRGEAYTTSFTTDGVYAYSCTYHPGMSGAIVVGGDGFGSDIAPAPVTAPSAPAAADGGRLAAGAFGLLVGVAAGVGLGRVRRRTGGA
jgi:plastocyanin